LQIWLHEPSTIRSEVVCARVEVPGEKRDNYYRRSKNEKSFPHRKWASDAYDLNKFNWKLYDYEDLRFKRAEELDDEEISELIKHGYVEEQIEMNNQNDIMYSKKTGYVWVGRLK
jgi:hypothetical protein